MTSNQSADDALEPIRRALIRRARQDAAEILDQARAAARAAREQAEAEATAITERAAAAGRARAARQLAAEHRDAARRRRARDLAARREIYDRWCAASTEAVTRMRFAPEYPQLLSDLRECAHRMLGPQARMIEDPAGGLVARADGRILDLRLTTIAARALDQVADRIATPSREIRTAPVETGRKARTPGFVTSGGGVEA